MIKVVSHESQVDGYLKGTFDYGGKHSLLDSDLLGSRSSGFGNHDRKNAILQAGLDIVLVDAAREGEGALELADGALTGPEAVAGLRLGLVTGLGDGSVIIAGALLRLSAVILALGATLHDQSVGVGELNVDVLLGNTRQLTIQMVGVLTLADIKARIEGAAGGLAAGTVDIIVIQEAEERGEVARGEAGTEERHGVEMG